MLGLISFIFVIGTAMLIHEFGHFLAFGKFGVLRHEFSIGFGPTLWKTRKGETQYTLRAIPIGGYVSVAAGESEIQMVQVGKQMGIRLNPKGRIERIFFNPKPEPGILIGTIQQVDLYDQLTLTLGSTTYNVEENAMYEDMLTKEDQYIAPFNRCMESKPKFARIIAFAAGALMNFLLAFLFVFIVGLVQGEPVLTNHLESVAEGMPAQLAGLQPGDQIISYDGQSITTGAELLAAIRSTTDEVEVTIIRNDEVQQLTLTPNAVQHEGRLIPQIGIGMVQDRHFSLSYAITYGWNQFKAGFALIFNTFEMLFLTHESGVQDLMGPVGIAIASSQAAAQGFLSLLWFASIINVNLGLMNLLPLPALDGGRIIFILIEGLIGRPINRRLEGYVHATGFFLFMGLFIFIFINDLSRVLF